MVNNQRCNETKNIILYNLFILSIIKIINECLKNIDLEIIFRKFLWKKT